MTKKEIENLKIEEIDKLFDEASALDLTSEEVELIKLRINELAFGKVRISNFVVEKENENLKSIGERRRVTITGTPKAGFTISIKDSSGCSIMENELENVEIPNNGKYVFTQEFPNIKGGLISEHYEIILTPHANVRYGYGVENIILNQYPISTITFKAPLTSIKEVISAATLSGDADSTLVQRGEGSGSVLQGSWTTIVSESSSTDGFFYVKSYNFGRATSSSTAVKKVVNRPGSSFRDKSLNLKPLTSGIKNSIISGDLVSGMTLKGTVEKVKMVTNSLEVPNCKKKTDKFELENTTGLFSGMSVYYNGTIVAAIESVDCAKNITVSKKLIIRKDSNATFKFTSGAIVSKVLTQMNSDNEACISVDRDVYIPNGMVLEFDDNKTQFIGSIVPTGSGTNTVTLTKTVTTKSFGIYDTTYTLDLSNLITRKPNIRNHYFTTEANSAAKTFNLSNGDIDGNKLTKRHAITKGSSHGVVTVGIKEEGGLQFPNLTYTPNPNFVGEEVIKYRVTHDGTTALVDDDTATNPMSDEKTIIITVK